MFFRHIKAAAKTSLPIMIHMREAEDDLLELLHLGIKQFGKLTGVIHCFTSTKEFAEEMLKLGFYISASGIITFKSGSEILETFKTIPLDKILIETDSPYLAPVPYRGKTNEPAYIVKTAEKLAEIKGLTVEQIANITHNNFYSLYQKKTK
jgi:TatD DNase family protein